MELSDFVEWLKSIDAHTKSEAANLVGTNDTADEGSYEVNSNPAFLPKIDSQGRIMYALQLADTISFTYEEYFLYITPKGILYFVYETGQKLPIAGLVDGLELIQKNIIPPPPYWMDSHVDVCHLLFIPDDDDTEEELEEIVEPNSPQ